MANSKKVRFIVLGFNGSYFCGCFFVCSVRDSSAGRRTDRRVVKGAGKPQMTAEARLPKISAMRDMATKCFVATRLLFGWVDRKKKVWSCSLIHIEVLTKPWYK